MRQLIATFTDFGIEGPYLGQVRAVFHREAPEAQVLDLLVDAPAFSPLPASYLLAALAPEMPVGTVMFCVVDPGVGGERAALAAEIDGRTFVGPDNGLFEIPMRRAQSLRCWEVLWRPDRLSATFHGRDLFAPVAAKLARGLSPADAGCRPCEPPRRADWPDDLAEIVYTGRYANAFTGIRADQLPVDAEIELEGGPRLRNARTYSDVPDGTAFWYRNSVGLVEIAVRGASAAASLEFRIGYPLRICG